MNWNTTGLFDLSHSLAGNYLARFTYPWQALDGIKELILSLGPAPGPATCNNGQNASRTILMLNKNPMRYLVMHGVSYLYD